MFLDDDDDDTTKSVPYVDHAAAVTVGPSWQQLEPRASKAALSSNGATPKGEQTKPAAQHESGLLAAVDGDGADEADGAESGDCAGNLGPIDQAGAAAQRDALDEDDVDDDGGEDGDDGDGDDQSVPQGLEKYWAQR